VNSRQKSQEKEPRPDTVPGAAVYPGKEAWKNQPGHRYTPEELRAMDQNWEVRITIPPMVHTRRAD
jgi:hypothetical protein